MDFIEAVKRIRNEHPEVGGLVMARDLVQKYGSYEAVKAVLTEGRPDPDLQKHQELIELRRRVKDLERELDSARAAADARRQIVERADKQRDEIAAYAERLTDVLKRAKSTLEIGRQFASDPVEMVQNWSGHASIVEGMIDEVLAAEGGLLK